MLVGSAIVRSVRAKDKWWIEPCMHPFTSLTRGEIVYMQCVNKFVVIGEDCASFFGSVTNQRQASIPFPLLFDRALDSINASISPIIRCVARWYCHIGTELIRPYWFNHCMIW